MVDRDNKPVQGEADIRDIHFALFGIKRQGVEILHAIKTDMAKKAVEYRKRGILLNGKAVGESFQRDGHGMPIAHLLFRPAAIRVGNNDFSAVDFKLAMPQPDKEKQSSALLKSLLSSKTGLVYWSRTRRNSETGVIKLARYFFTRV